MSCMATMNILLGLEGKVFRSILTSACHLDRPPRNEKQILRIQ